MSSVIRLGGSRVLWAVTGRVPWCGREAGQTCGAGPCHTRGHRPVGSHVGLDSGPLHGTGTAPPHPLTYRHRTKGMGIVTVCRSEKVIGEFPTTFEFGHRRLDQEERGS